MFSHNRIDFYRNKVLKAEFLQESADNAEEMFGLLYRNYSDGIVEGADITVAEKYLTVHPGIIKYRGILYRMTEEERIPYEHSERKMFFRIRFLEELHSGERTQYVSEFVLTDEETAFPYEMELGRFIAEKGAVLYADYTDLEAAAVKYNQFDIRNVPYAGIGESTISPKITAAFGRSLLKKHTENSYDIAFAMQCLGKRPVEREIIVSYLAARTGSDAKGFSNEEIYEKFLEILRQGARAGRQGTEAPVPAKRRIIVD